MRYRLHLYVDCCVNPMAIIRDLHSITSNSVESILSPYSEGLRPFVKPHQVVNPLEPTS